MQTFHIRQVFDDGSEQSAGFGVTFPDGTTVLQLQFWQSLMTFTTTERAYMWLESQYVRYRVVTKPPFPGAETDVISAYRQALELYRNTADNLMQEDMLGWRRDIATEHMQRAEWILKEAGL